MIWTLYLVVSIAFNILAVLLAPILPAFATSEGVLPKWLEWFGTPDNTLDGDQSDWTSLPNGSYLRRVLWLWRNPAYCFEQRVLGARVTEDMLTYVSGDIWIKNRANAVEGSYYTEFGGWWNWKWIEQISEGMCVMVEFGWKLQDVLQDPKSFTEPTNVQFVCSVRLSAFNPKNP